MYFNSLKLDPVHVISDHTLAVFKMCQEIWPKKCADDYADTFFIQCFPHFRCKIVNVLKQYLSVGKFQEM